MAWVPSEATSKDIVFIALETKGIKRSWTKALA